MTILTLQPDETSGIDTRLDSLNTTTNYATDGNIQVGERDDVATQILRTLIKFDLSVIPRTARVISANLTLTVNVERSSNARDQKVYRVLRNWVESEATWANWSSGNAWSAGGCSSSVSDYDPTVWATLNLSATEASDAQKTWSLDATEFTKMVNGTYPNYGWLIAADTQNNDCIFYYSSAEANAVRRPKLVVDYGVYGGSPAISPFMKF